MTPLRGNAIKAALASGGLKQLWLIEQLKEAGLPVYDTQMSAILAGRIKGPKAERVLSESERILGLK